MTDELAKDGLNGGLKDGLKDRLVAGELVPGDADAWIWAWTWPMVSHGSTSIVIVVPVSVFTKICECECVKFASWVSPKAVQAPSYLHDDQWRVRARDDKSKD